MNYAESKRSTVTPQNSVGYFREETSPVQQPNDPKSSLKPEPTDQAATPASRTAAEAIPRRLLFSGGLIGLLGQVACSSADLGGPAAP